MRNARRIAAPVTALVFVLGLSACNGDGERLSESEFLSQGNEICREGNERIEAIENEAFGELDQGEEPTPAALEQFKDDLVAEIRSQIDDVGDLEPPSDLEEDVDNFLDDANAAVDELDAMTVEELFASGEEDDPFADVEAQANDLGLDECADSGDESGDEGGEGDEQAGEVNPEFAEYCAASAELDSQQGPPTEAQLEELRGLAPDEISEEVDFVVDRFIEEGEGAFGDPAVGQRFEAIEAFEAENCGATEGGGERGDPEPAEGANVVEVTGVEYAFEGVPEEIPAGPTALGFTNEGAEEHEMFIGKLAEGVTIEDVLAFEGDPFEEGLVTEDLGGTVASPGDPESYLNVDLEAGTYGMVCFVPSSDGQPHDELGMATEFAVS